MTVSALDSVPGLGESKRKALLAQFGSVKSIKAATAAELTVGQGHRAVAGRGDRAALRPGGRRRRRRALPAINMTTGEILET